MKKTFVFLLMCFCSAFSAEYSDNFNRELLGSDWVTIPTVNGLTIKSSDTLSHTVGTARNGAYYHPSANADSQFVTATIYYVTNVGYTFVCARVDTVAMNMYVFGANDNNEDIVIGKYTDGTYSTISATTAYTIHTGDVIGLLVFHDTLIGYINGTPTDTAIDASFSSGRIGCVQYAVGDANSIGYWDNFHAWDNSGGGAPDCDSVHQVGFVDSLPTRLIYKATVGCTTTDTIRTVWGEDTTALDTNYHAGTFSAGDTIRDTMTSLMPSTKYYAASIDSMFKTAYASAWTTDSIDSTEIEVTGYTLTVNNDGHGSTDPSGATDVDSGAGTAISASASSHYHFLNWSVTSGTGVTFSSTTSASSACTLKVESATIQANFGIDTFHIANTITGGHATIAYGTDSIAAYAEPCSLFLTVESGYLANWPGGNDITGGKDTLVVVASADSAVAVTVRAWPQYNLTVSNDGHGNTSPSGITAVDSAASTPLSATSGTGYGFVNWTVTSGSGYAFGDADDSTTTIALSSGNVAIQANFDLDTFYVARNPGANGAMSTDDADTIYAYGESARVIITPDPGYRIVGNQDSLPDTLQFTVTKDTTVSATFEAWPTFTVDSTIVNGRPDSVIFSDYGSVDSGKTITVTIHNPADTQCTVSGDTSGILTGFTDVVNANKSYVFTFDEIPDTAPPTMVTSPAQVHDSLGETDTVFAAATGGGTITYQWQFYSGGWSDTAVTNDSLFYLLTLAKAGDSCRCIAVNDYGADTSSAFAIVVHYSPVVIDSLRPNPVYRLDSCTIYLKSARLSGTVTVLQLDTVLTPKYYSDTQIDIYTGDWERGWYDIEVTNNLGLKDTGYLRIVVPRKTN